MVKARSSYSWPEGPAVGKLEIGLVFQRCMICIGSLHSINIFLNGLYNLVSGCLYVPVNVFCNFASIQANFFKLYTFSMKHNFL
jgi:hypothetical protein